MNEKKWLNLFLFLPFFFYYSLWNNVYLFRSNYENNTFEQIVKKQVK